MTEQEAKHESGPALRLLAEQHVRSMLNYYRMRYLMNELGMAEAERTSVRSAAIETRRYGFRLEAQVEPLGLFLDTYDEERLRREASRINHLAYRNWDEANRVSEQVIMEMVNNTLLVEEACVRTAA